MVLKFFDVVLKFELPRARCLNFPKNSASVLIRLVLIIGDCMYLLFSSYVKNDAGSEVQTIKYEIFLQLENAEFNKSHSSLS